MGDSDVLERGLGAATQFYAFPQPHWPRLRTTRASRLHGEIKRRVITADAFPDRASALRLVTAGRSSQIVVILSATGMSYGSLTGSRPRSSVFLWQAGRSPIVRVVARRSDVLR